MIELDAPPTRIFAEALAALSLWEYGIKPAGIVGYFTGYTFPEEWDDVVRFDLEAGELDIEQLIVLDPDISIGFTWDTVTKNDFGAIDESTLPGFLDVAPSLCILAVGASIDASIERFVELAAALGADTDSEIVVAARDAFTAAAEAVRAATAAKPELTVIAMSGAIDNAWIGNPTVASDLVYFANLGVTFVIPETPQEYASGLWQQISWEQIGEYQADIYLLDNRPSSLPVDDYQDIPIVQLIPAFQADQVTSWPVEYVFSYDGLTPTLTALAEAISSGRGGHRVAPIQSEPPALLAASLFDRTRSGGAGPRPTRSRSHRSSPRRRVRSDVTQRERQSR